MPNRLPNTSGPRSSGNIFLPRARTPPAQQPLRGVGPAQQPLRGVGQDNPTPPIERVASHQPGAVRKEMRSQQTNTPTPHSPTRSTPNRRTVQLIVWVNPLIKAEIQRTAAREGLSVSRVGAALLEQAIRQDIHGQYNALIQPMIEQTVRRELRSFSNRLVIFLIRIAFAAEQSRILITNILDRILRREGVTPETFTNLVDRSNTMARRNIIHKSPQLQSLLEEWERSFHNEHE